MKRIHLLMIPALLTAVLLFGGFPVHGATTTTTMHVHQGTMTFSVTNPCSGEPGMVTITFNAVMHITIGPNGSHLSATETGVFTFAQDNGVTYTGHFTMKFGANAGPGRPIVATSTFSIHGVGSDGSILRVNSVMHMTVNPDGAITSQVMRLNCHQ